MPIYEYKCKKCDHVFEEFVFSSNTGSEDIICPVCGEKNADKLMSAFSASGTSSIGSGASSCGPSGFG
ncbi:MAG: zinc ribbon domain-containing protein [Calditrichia bacterium]|jgi:putative FmdB family regulatory protein|nr:zinc ribbon domain-containing protein [Calditrichia bacterium]